MLCLHALIRIDQQEGRCIDGIAEVLAQYPKNLIVGACAGEEIEFGSFAVFVSLYSRFGVVLIHAKGDDIEAVGTFVGENGLHHGRCGLTETTIDEEEIDAYGFSLFEVFVQIVRVAIDVDEGEIADRLGRTAKVD